MRIHKEGIEGIKINTLIFLLIIAVVTATGLVYDWAWWVLALVDGFLLWRIAFVIRFFRDPERPQLTDVEGVFSPADGKVVVIEEVDEPEVMGGRCIQLSVYMNFYNVHVNWAPVGGEVTYKNHYNGEFVLAWRPKSSHLNEHTTIGVRTERGTVVMFRQIAGWIARRIVAYPQVGDKLVQNSKFGFIKFGSRVDVFLPLGSEVLVELGQKVVGSQTMLARLPQNR
ncbi:MAG: phosphatidylserine decarboxylase family protein [Tidjanibacter sp.]|nr:phosphatidylserine decarboxylase family protein [Tidjanibacter sp.]